MRVAVIGGSGFIGSHLVDKLLAEGHDVTVYDIMKPQRDVRHIFIDIMDFHRTVVALAGGYDVFYVLAAMANVDDIVKSPLETAIVNFQGIANILEAVRRYGGRIILASTVWVYMLANEEEVTEDTPLLVQNVNHTYTATKVAAELYIQSYNKLYDIPFSILRYGIPYGPRGRDGTVITNFVARALRNEPIIIHGDGSQHRDFVFVEDLVEGNVAALQDIGINKTYNLAGRRAVTIKEVAETVSELAGGTRIDYIDKRSGDFRGRSASSEKAFRELSWKPRVDLKEGIQKYIEWYKGVKGCNELS